MINRFSTSGGFYLIEGDSLYGPSNDYLCIHCGTPTFRFDLTIEYPLHLHCESAFYAVECASKVTG